MPLFSQRHYNAIARAISEASDCGDASPFVRALSDLFTQDNSAFRPPMFKAACSTNPPPPALPEPEGSSRQAWWITSVDEDDGIETIVYYTEADYENAREIVLRDFRQDRVRNYNTGMTRVPTPPPVVKRVYWVATYGDDGLEVSHYYSEAEYIDMTNLMMCRHDDGDLDSYTNGWEDVSCT